MLVIIRRDIFGPGLIICAAQEIYFIRCHGSLKKVGKNLAKCLVVQRQVLKETDMLSDP